MVIYLVGKGFAFSPPRSTTGREQKPSSLGNRKRERRGGAGRNGEKRTENISFMSVSPVTPTLSLPLSLTAVMEVKVWPQTERGARKKNYMSIFVPSGCLDRNRYITFS